MALPANVTDPGLVNVEDQAYPIVPPGYQALPPNLGSLLSASLFAPPIVPQSVQAIPRAVPVDVAAQPFIPRSFSSGAAAVIGAGVDIKTQNVIRQPVRDYVVTDVGNFQTGVENSNVTLAVTSVVDAQTGLAVSAATTLYKVFVSGAVLSDLGLTLVGREVVFTGNVTAAIIDEPRTISAFGYNFVIVPRTEFGTTLSAVQPVAGDTMLLDTERDGDEVVFDTFSTPVNVVIAPSPTVAETEVGESIGFQGNILAGSGVVSAFIGSGVRTPPFQGTTEVANQVPLSSGLPANVFQ